MPCSRTLVWINVIIWLKFCHNSEIAVLPHSYNFSQTVFTIFNVYLFSDHFHDHRLVFHALQSSKFRGRIFDQGIFITMNIDLIYCHTFNPRGWKNALLPHRGSFPVGKICLIKTWVTHPLTSKAHWKWHFYWKPMKQKSI
jgi:hypothetical protein